MELGRRLKLCTIFCLMKRRRSWAFLLVPDCLKIAPFGQKRLWVFSQLEAFTSWWLMKLQPTAQVAQTHTPRDIFGEVFGCYEPQIRWSTSLGKHVITHFQQWTTCSIVTNSLCLLQHVPNPNRGHFACCMGLPRGSTIVEHYQLDAAHYPSLTGGFF